MPQIHQLSQQAHDRLLAELTDLTTRGRIDIARKIEAARELGDLSENGDYHAAKEEKGKMEGRVMHIESVLEDCEIVESPVGPVDEVTTGVIVTVLYEGDDEPERMLVGSIEEQRDDVVVVSPRSPLGEVLLGSSVGQEVTFVAPNGDLQVRIIDIGE
ncbi:MAG: transcription elongation factor GreA [Acidimicrobiales bacterium]|nr:transcription elongation factor GreA [Acidimicrobiales bacterium]